MLKVYADKLYIVLYCVLPMGMYYKYNKGVSFLISNVLFIHWKKEITLEEKYFKIFKKEI